MRLRLGALLATVGLVLVAAPAAAAGAPLPVSYNFLQNTLSVNVAASAPGENDWSCRPTAAHPEPIVLVHGTGGNAATNWVTYAALLADHGYCVFALTYGVAPSEASSPVVFGGMNEIASSARELQAFVAKVLTTTGARKVDIVGHSQGTYMPNYWVRFLGGARYVDRYVSLAPLWRGTGTSIAGQLNAAGAPYHFTSDSLVPVCVACGEMATGSRFATLMSSGRVAARGVKYLNISTRYDELVLPYTSGQVSGYRSMHNVVIQDRCPTDFTDHFEIASDPNAAQLVLNFLDPAHARPLTCRTVLPFNGFVYDGVGTP